MGVAVMHRPVLFAVAFIIGSSVGCFGGCAQRTEIVVGVATDLKARGQIDSVQFIASRNGTPIVMPPPWMLADQPAGSYELPGSFGIYSPDGSETRVELTVKGFLGDTLVTERDSIVSLVSGSTLFMRLSIVGDCGQLSTPTCAAGETCVEGVCRPVAQDSHRFPPYRRELVTSTECDSGTHFVVSSTGVPMASSGTTCAADEYCQEGTCYKLLRGEDGAVATGVWTEQATPTTYTLRALWGTPDGADVFAVGDHGTILHLHGGGPANDSAWVMEPVATVANLYAVGGTSAVDVWAAGDGAFVHRDGSATWTVVPPAPTAARIDGLSGHYAVGRSDATDGLVLSQVGAVWQATATTMGDMTSIFSATDGDVWLAGPGGVAHGDGTTFSAQTVPAGDYTDIFGRYVVGRDGVILQDLAAQDSGVSTDLFAVRDTGADVFVVGDFGVVLHLEGATWVRQSTSTRQPLLAVWGSSAGDLYSVGYDGVVLHSTGAPLMGALCAVDGDCASGNYCDPSGACRAPKAQGTTCDDSAGADCKQGGCRVCGASLFCTDHVCCDQSATSCAGCMHCNAPTGICAAVANGQDPRGTCAGMTAECQQTTCNGQGGCGNTGNPCGTTTCASGALTSSTCQNGSCTADAPVSCPSPPTCADGSSCVGACATDSDCAATDYCDNNGLCRTRKAQAATCNTVTQCKVAGCRECKAAFTCVDGYCCNAACNGGPCQACDVATMEGSCVNVPSGQPHGARGSCPGAGVGSCGQYCGGSSTACVVPSGVCNAASCQNGYTILNATSCNTTTGTCPAQSATTDCGRQTCLGGACVACTAGGSCTPTYPVCNATTTECCNQSCAPACANDGQFPSYPYNDALTAGDCSTGACDNHATECANPAGVVKSGMPFMCASGACYTSCHCFCRAATGAPTTTLCAKPTDCTNVNSGWFCPSSCQSGAVEGVECGSPSVYCHPDSVQSYCQLG